MSYFLPLFMQWDRPHCNAMFSNCSRPAAQELTTQGGGDGLGNGLGDGLGVGLAVGLGDASTACKETDTAATKACWHGVSLGIEQQSSMLQRCG
jgi:hypothetical protein